MILSLTGDVGVLAGDNITLDCTVLSQDNMPSITWTTPAGDVVTGAEYWVDEMTVVSSLALSLVTSADDGTYVCAVEDGVMIFPGTEAVTIAVVSKWY